MPEPRLKIRMMAASADQGVSDDDITAAIRRHSRGANTTRGERQRYYGVKLQRKMGRQSPHDHLCDAG